MVELSKAEAWWSRLGLRWPDEVDARYDREQQEQIETIWRYQVAAAERRRAEAAERARRGF